ncbi:hypothetical protein GRF29_8g666571 [Pseudopithomyces chartarum]|uniref:C-type lectin domain-containing protein n=1 Tax=Pseudopithomyces chartarum TaxID=1892770 RepID=A0AAN6M3F6_9PLEO|nr:hypothetical protein GRF29_8g666571 [Pseudopithomyces chartarum]
MLVQLLIFVLSALALSVPDPQIPNGEHLNCTFIVQIKEVCRFNDKFVEKMDLNTEARINSISSPKGNPVANYNEGLHINKESLSIHTNVPQEIVVGELDIARPDNAGDVNFQWTYNPSGGRPLTEEWTESKNGTDDRYGCFGQDWNEGKTPVCSYDHPVTERPPHKCDLYSTMLSKLFLLIIFAVMAMAAPSELATRDWRNCKFTTYAVETCQRDPSTGTPTKTTRVQMSNVLTPSGNPIPDIPSGDSLTPLTVHISNRDEKIDGDLTINAAAAGNKLQFGWTWVNPETKSPETVTWGEDDDGKTTRYGCQKHAWSKDGTECSSTENPEDRREVQLNCFFRCRN